MSWPEYSTGAGPDHGETPSPVRAISYGASQVPSNPVAASAVVGTVPAMGNPLTTSPPTTALSLPPVNTPAARTTPTAVPTATTPTTTSATPPGAASPTPRTPVTVRGTVPTVPGRRREGATATSPASE